MRWRLLCGLALGIAAGAHAAAIAAQPADGPGCVGVRAEECVRWLQATMTIDANFLATAMAHRHESDVNGRPIGGGWTSDCLLIVMATVLLLEAISMRNGNG